MRRELERSCSDGQARSESLCTLPPPLHRKTSTDLACRWSRNCTREAIRHSCVPCRSAHPVLLATDPITGVQVCDHAVRTRTRELSIANMAAVDNPLVAELARRGLCGRLCWRTPSCGAQRRRRQLARANSRVKRPRAARKAVSTRTSPEPGHLPTSSSSARRAHVAPLPLVSVSERERAQWQTLSGHGDNGRYSKRSAHGYSRRHASARRLSV